MPKKSSKKALDSGTQAKYPKSEYSLAAQQKQKAIIAAILDSNQRTSDISSKNSESGQSSQSSVDTAKITSQDSPIISGLSYSDSQDNLSDLASQLAKVEYIDEDNEENIDLVEPVKPHVADIGIDFDMKSPKVILPSKPHTRQWIDILIIYIVYLSKQ